MQELKVTRNVAREMDTAISRVITKFDPRYNEKEYAALQKLQHSTFTLSNQSEGGTLFLDETARQILHHFYTEQLSDLMTDHYVKQFNASKALVRDMLGILQPEEEKEKQMLKKRAWSDFRNAGLLGFTNMILHMFGWALTIEMNDQGEIISAYPARTKFRGFDESTTSDIYAKVSNYLAENSKVLAEEAND